MTALPDTASLRAEVEDFLYTEAALLDAQDYQAWLRLFAPDAVYWIPAAGDAIDPSVEVSIVYDDIAFLSERAWRFDSGLAYAQEPRSRTAHLVSNVRLLGADAAAERPEEEFEVEARFLVAEFRRGRRYQHAGRYHYRMRREGSGLRIVRKKVELVDNDGHLGNLSLLL